jgi:transcriptional regulator with XRE-family HTH domain
MPTQPRRTPRAIPDRHDLGHQLRAIIASRGLTSYALGQAAAVDPGQISRFLNGTRDLRLETAGRIARALGLRLVEVARPTRRKAAGKAPHTPPEPSPTPGPCDPPSSPDGPSEAV